MKLALSTVTLFLFLFTFSTKASGLRADTPEAVVDISGEELKAGASYYVFPATGGRGGLSFNTFGNDTCPHVVVQEWSELSKGKPVQFLPLNPENDAVFTSTNLNIKFSEMISICVESGVWKITKRISEARHVGTNGTAGANQDFVNWFMIEKAETEGAYKLKFCPNAPYIVCQDLGIFYWGDDGKRYVGLANPGEFEPLTVVFQKANDVNAVMSI
ncbi:kunitz trypsin inhibitor 5-like [Prosopis cineraria]|uniref:kunitz trypsin inhibitor 5-like n=1 Tax=Prosopis cineraria TaxID=364024 RepID=UPI00241068FF|nr:kunitz trypsin inhibitor 5-like [Prosopis cineraria]